MILHPLKDLIVRKTSTLSREDHDLRIYDISKPRGHKSIDRGYVRPPSTMKSLNTPI